MPRFEFDSVHLEPGSVGLVAELFARLVATFRLETGRGTVYEEDDFPFLELAVALMRWLNRWTVGSPGSDFEFDSMSFEETGVIWIRAYGDGWRVGSMYQDIVTPEAFSSEEVAASIRDFYDRSLRSVPQDFMGSISRLVDAG